jgi:hypothetical protein
VSLRKCKPRSICLSICQLAVSVNAVSLRINSCSDFVSWLVATSHQACYGKAAGVGSGWQGGFWGHA